MKIIATIISSLLTLVLIAQEPAWIQMDDNYPTGGNGGSIGLDNQDNIYIASGWSYPGWWDRGTSIIKYSPGGVKLWMHSKQVDTASMMGMATNEAGVSFIILNNRPWTPFACIYAVDSSGNELYFNKEEDVSYNGLTCDALGNSYVTGYRYVSYNQFEMIVIKYNINGVKEWQTNWPLAGESTFGGKILLDNQFLFVYGRTSISNVITKFDLNGSFINHTLFFEDLWMEFLFRSVSDISIDNAENIYVTGMNELECTGQRFGYIYKFDQDISEIWHDSISLINNSMYDIAFDQNSNVILCGYDYDQHYACYAKYNEGGTKLWHHVYDSCISSLFRGTESYLDKIYYTGSIYKEGTVGHKYFLYVTDLEGNYINQYLCPGSEISTGAGNDMVLDQMGNLITTGVFEDTSKFCMTIKFDILTSEKEIPLDVIKKPIIYPNPSKKDFTIEVDLDRKSHCEIVLYTLHGERLKVLSNSILPPGNQKLYFVNSGLQPGIYMLDIRMEEYHDIQKLIILD